MINTNWFDVVGGLSRIRALVFAALVLAVPLARGADIVNNLSLPSLGAYSLSLSEGQAQSFMNGPGLTAFTNVSVILSHVSGPSSTVKVQLRADSAGLPGSIIEVVGSNTFSSVTPTNYTFTAKGTNVLSANTKYWIALLGVSGTSQWQIVTNTTSTGIGTMLDTDAYSLNTGGVWNAGETNQLFMLAVRGSYLDYGDAPSAAQSGSAGTYPVTLASNGARHIISGPRLGSLVDGETNGFNSANANGDDTNGSDDEDGISVGLLTKGTSASIGITVSGANGKVDAWLDWNRDGDWNDAGEKIATNFTANVGSTNISVAVPAGASNGTSYLRVRISTAGNLAVTNLAMDGEVEDHPVSVYDPTPVHFVNIANSTPAFPYATWATAATNIQDAIDAAINGDTVMVTNGVYQTGGRVVTGSLLTNRIVIDKPIPVQSVNGPAVTIIKGAKDPFTNGNAAVRCAWMTNGASLIGFTLTNGATRTTGASDTDGGGLWAQSASVVVSNSIFTGNSADANGGGAYGGTLNNCQFIGNRGNLGGGAGFNQNPGTLNNCTLTGNSAGSTGGGAYQGTLSNCVLTANSANIGGGAYQGTLYNCTLTSNSVGNSGGGASECTLNNCALIGNSATSDGGGADFGTLNNCTLTGNSAGSGGGGAYQGALNNCTLASNSAVGAGGGAYQGTLNNCIVYFNVAKTSNNYFLGTVSYTCTTPLPAGTGNITNDPQFVNAGAGNYRLKSTSPCRDTGTNSLVVGSTDLDGNPRIQNVTVDMGAYEFVPDTNPVHFVALNNPTPAFPFASWATAATNIQDAIDAADAGDTVLVSNGVYQTGGRVVGGTLVTNRVVIDKAIPVRSVNGPAVTIIKGAGPVGDAAIRCAYVANGASLSGFTLTNGATRTFILNNEAASGGGGVLSESGGTLSNCVLTGNSAGESGGGAYQGTLNNCVLTGNSSGNVGGGAKYGTLNNCTLTGNSAGIGGGAYQSTLNNCTLTGNAVGNLGGGAAYGTLNNCKLSGNSADFFGGGTYASTLNNCILTGNSASRGGGAYSATLNNCTLTDNSAGVEGGGADLVTLNNCIVYFNSASSDANYLSSTISYTCTTPLPAGAGNITNNPLFVSLATTNLVLAAGSPCRDTGINANAPAGPDLEGNPRIVNAVVDMGAYENQSVPSPDYDGDGMPNADETIAGSSAVNSTSVWKITSLTVTNPASISFASVAGRLYAVDRNDALVPAPQVWTEFTNNILGTGGLIIINDPLPGTNRCYRVRVKLL